MDGNRVGTKCSTDVFNYALKQLRNCQVRQNQAFLKQPLAELRDSSVT